MKYARVSGSKPRSATPVGRGGDTYLSTCNAAACLVAAVMVVAGLGLELRSESASPAAPVFATQVNASSFGVGDASNRNSSNATDWLAFQPAFQASKEFDVHPAACVIVFGLVTALEHGVAFVLLRNGRATLELLEDVRYAGYAVSATAMKVAIDVMAGVRDRDTLLMIAAATAVSMLCGSLSRVSHVATASSWILTTASWAVTVSTFVRISNQLPEGRGPPDFVLAIVWSQLVLFNLFGVVHAVDFFCWRRRKPERSIVAFNALSIGAKGLLVALVLGGLYV